MKGRSLDRADLVHQREPDPSRRKPGDQRGIEKRHDQLPVHGDFDRLEHGRTHRENGSPHEHLQTHDHHDVPARGCPPHGQGGHGQRRCTKDAKRQTVKVDPGIKAGAHDQPHTEKAEDKPDQAKARQFFTKDRPSRKGDHQGHGRGDDRRDRGFNRLHRDEVQPKVKRVLTEAKDDRRTPLRLCQAKGLSQRQGYADADQPRQEETQRQGGQWRRIGHDDPSRGKGRRPHQGKHQPHGDCANIQVSLCLFAGLP